MYIISCEVLLSNFTRKLKILIYRGVRNVSFSENFAYVLNDWPHLKEHLFSYIERYHGKKSVFIDAERKYYTMIYNIISGFLVWVAPKPLPVKLMNVLVLGLYYPPESLL